MDDSIMRKIPLIKPYLPPEAKDSVWKVLESGYLTEGPVTAEFETTVKEYVGCGHVIAVTSCTTGLEFALRALGIGPGDEVIVPDYTYPATADAVAIVGATIVIVDVSPETMLIDYAAIETAIGPKTKAVIPVSLFGNPLDYSRLNTIKKKFGVYLIEDAACSLGAEYNGTRIGNQADISVFSLHPRKFITTGEGGLITTDSSQWADWIHAYKHFGMAGADTRSNTVFDRIGTNAKLSNILAAVGLAQMKHIATLLARRIALAENYRRLLAPHHRIILPALTQDAQHSYQSFCILIENRNRVLEKMRTWGIEVQIGTYALHQHRAFFPSDTCVVKGPLSGSTEVFDKCLALPLYHELTSEDQIYIVDKLIQAMKIKS
jgi:perosamine synthetase